MNILEVTPEAAHGVFRPLNWSNAAGKPDGDVMRELAADGSRNLHPQPRRDNYQGVSFFQPSSVETAKIAHDGLGKPVHRCGVTSPGVPLPHNLRFIQDCDLMMPVFDEAANETVLINCGKHLTLYTTTKTSTKAFEADYIHLMSTSTIPCDLAAGAGPTRDVPTRDVDWDYLPADPKTRVSVMALDQLVYNSEDPNVRLFGTLYTLHLRAADMTFDEVLQFKPAASLVAFALDQWTITEPLLVVHVQAARELLTAELEYEFSKLQYKPYWDVHPFQFMHGKYSDELYEAEVQTCALGYTRDKDLKAKVQRAAMKLFAQLNEAPEACQYDDDSFVHNGLTIVVRCARACDENGRKTR